MRIKFHLIIIIIIIIIRLSSLIIDTTPNEKKKNLPINTNFDQTFLRWGHKKWDSLSKKNSYWVELVCTYVWYN